MSEISNVVNKFKIEKAYYYGCKEDLKKAYQQGRADALDIDMDKPMHFTNEQKAWIKKYIIINGKANYERGAREFAEYLQKYICVRSCGDTKCINDKKCVWYYDINDALDEWQKEIENN